jgi:hypothetical protein
MHDRFDDGAEPGVVSVRHEEGMTILRFGGAIADDGVCDPDPGEHGCVGCDPDPNVCVPDFDCVTVEVPIRGAPSDARVNMMHLHMKIQGQTGSCGGEQLWCSDIFAAVSDSQRCRSELVLWDRQGSSTDRGLDDDEENDRDIELHRSFDRFNGCEVNQTWNLQVCDEVFDDAGEIDYFEIWLCYEGEAQGCRRDPQWVCDGDVDGDGQVNPVDSGIVQANFGSFDEQALCNYDIDCDGQINPVDAGIVQSLFGTCDAPREVCP